MPQYIGFSTRNANIPPTRNAIYGTGSGVGGVPNPVYSGNKFQEIDEQLVITDFINALNIRQGEKVGQPSYGTTIWNFVFEPNTQDMQYVLQQEITRVAESDKRLTLEYVRAYPKENGILMEVQISVVPFNQSTLLSVFFDSTTNTASVQS